MQQSRYRLRDIDGSADNAISQAALQYRIGESGNFINIPSAYVSDASTGPSLATLVTPVTAVLPASANNQAKVQVRIITTDAASTDEWIGIDDIAVTSNAYNPLPITALPSSPTITEDSSANHIADISIADADGGNQTVTLIANNGTVSLATTTGISGLTGNGSANVSFSGALTDINTALASLSFTPAANFAGTATLRVQTNDGAGGTDDDTLDIMVNGVNDAPVIAIGKGQITTAIGMGSDSGRSVTVQSDGKILVAGYSHNGTNQDFALVRYNANGSLYGSFGSDGKITTDFAASNDYGFAVAVQADGKVLVGGRIANGSNYDFALARYNADGSLDGSFGTGGKVSTDLGSNDDVANYLALQADGKILLGGRSSNGSNTDFAVVRYNSNGTLDSSFSDDGKVITDFGATDNNADSITLGNDGKIIVAGSSNTVNPDFAVVRYNSDGSLDTSFGNGGQATTAVGSSHDNGHGLTVQTDNKILVTGKTWNGSDWDMALVRYNTNGILDMTFGTGGKVVTAIGTGIDDSRSVTVQADGKIVVVGRTSNGSNEDVALLRYNTDGSLDNSFGSGGKVTTAIGSRVCRILCKRTIPRRLTSARP